MMLNSSLIHVYSCPRNIRAGAYSSYLYIYLVSLSKLHFKPSMIVDLWQRLRLCLVGWKNFGLFSVILLFVVASLV